ncbi:MAG: hypothetical protein VKJ44_06150 [Synechococcus sp.]|nr:hypothetical protein [Synechococcus sp.]
MLRDRSLIRLRHGNVGTISADRSATVLCVRGAVLAPGAEALIGRLRPGHGFFFAGCQLELGRGSSGWSA